MAISYYFAIRSGTECTREIPVSPGCRFTQMKFISFPATASLVSFTSTTILMYNYRRLERSSPLTAALALVSH